MLRSLKSKFREVRKHILFLSRRRLLTNTARNRVTVTLIGIYRYHFYFLFSNLFLLLFKIPLFSINLRMILKFIRLFVVFIINSRFRIKVQMILLRNSNRISSQFNSNLKYEGTYLIVVIASVLIIIIATLFVINEAFVHQRFLSTLFNTVKV